MFDWALLLNRETLFNWYPANEYHFARTQLVLFTLGMGMTLSLADFLEITRRPRSFFVGLGVHLLVVPWIAVLLNWACDLKPGTAVGLILVAAMPGGALSKFFAYFGRGNMALSISLTGVTTLLTLATVPLMLHFLAAQHTPAGFEMPVVDVLIDVAICLLLPLLAGLTIGRMWPARRMLLSKICIRIGLVVVLVMIAGSLGSGRIRPFRDGYWVPFIVLIFCALCQQASMLPFRLFGWPRADRMAVGVESTMRNMNLALLINARLFSPEDDIGKGVLFVILFYAGAAMGFGFPLALNHRRMALKEKPADPEEVGASRAP